MDIRGKYFWIVDRLKRSGQEQAVSFNPSQYTPIFNERSAGKLHWDYFTDWEYYRADREMLQEGIRRLNVYYGLRMIGQFPPYIPFIDEQINFLLKIIESLGGVYGIRPAMEPYIPEPMRHALHRALRQFHPREKVYEYPIEGDKYAPGRPSRIYPQFISGAFQRIVNAPDFPRALFPFTDWETHLDIGKAENLAANSPDKEQYLKRVNLFRYLAEYEKRPCPPVANLVNTSVTPVRN